MTLQEIRKQFNTEDCYSKAWQILDDCEVYHQTDDGMDRVFDAWREAKSTPIWDGKSLFEILANHPNYIPEKGYIVFSNQYKRPIDFDTVNYIINTMYERCMNILEVIKIGAYSYRELISILDRLYSIRRSFGGFYETSKVTYKGNDLAYYHREYDRFQSLLSQYNKDNIEFIDGEPYNRTDTDKIKQFKSVLCSILDWIRDHKGDEILLADEEICERVFYITSIKIHEGTKIGKVIQRICREYGINKHPEYNSWIARLGDAISPIQFTRHTVISVNPIDYWTMSFGTNWCSCANIDKKHNRSSSDEGLYGDGCCSGGTTSYMLDPSTVVVYTIDSHYDGNDFELQDKVNRCLFHVGEGKFAMGRVYPQGTDGAESVYKQWREIFQHVIATCMDIPNYWATQRSDKNQQISSSGVQYEDYFMSYCDIAGWSWHKPTLDSVPSTVKIKIGRNPICPCCGKEHTWAEAIECEDCYNERTILGHCERCGSTIYEGDDEAIYCRDNDNWYCYYECAENDGLHYCEDDEEYHEEDYCYQDYYNDRWYAGDPYIETEDGHYFHNEHTAYNAGYAMADDCCWYLTDEIAVDTETGESFHIEDDSININGDWFMNETNAIAHGYECNEDGQWVESEVA